MRPLGVLAAIVVIAVASGASAQNRGTAPSPGILDPLPLDEPAMLNCPAVVGDGVLTARTYCDVALGTDPEQGIVIAIPPHVGAVTLLFDLHNRHVYSAELVKARKAYSRYTAGIGVMTLDNHLIARAAIQTEFRTEMDLFDRIAGGSNPVVLKAVAPTGIESIAVVIDEGESSVSILGEKLQVERIGGIDHFTAPGRPIALVSNVRLRYVPAPAGRGAGR